MSVVPTRHRPGGPWCSCRGSTGPALSRTGAQRRRNAMPVLHRILVPKLVQGGLVDEVIGHHSAISSVVVVAAAYVAMAGEAQRLLKLAPRCGSSRLRHVLNARAGRSLQSTRRAVPAVKCAIELAPRRIFALQATGHAEAGSECGGYFIVQHYLICGSITASTLRLASARSPVARIVPRLHLGYQPSCGGIWSRSVANSRNPASNHAGPRADRNRRHAVVVNRHGALVVQQPPWCRVDRGAACELPGHAVQWCRSESRSST